MRNREFDVRVKEDEEREEELEEMIHWEEDIDMDMREWKVDEHLVHIA